ncbi:hypothetical protein [Streptomyces sp. NPDC091209]|uniref:hypothetical protein n=1 Tax=Streptomyces sp. NPDC091209 TaxID=3365974 RepID=UPI003817369F
MLLHCAHATYVWNLAVEQHAHWHPGRKAAPGSVGNSPKPGVVSQVRTESDG